MRSIQKTDFLKIVERSVTTFNEIREVASIRSVLGEPTELHKQLVLVPIMQFLFAFLQKNSPFPIDRLGSEKSTHGQLQRTARVYGEAAQRKGSVHPISSVVCL